MRLKRKTFYFISLSLPYLALILGIAVLLFIYYSGMDPDVSASFSGILFSIVLFFSASGIIWAPLYTWMVAVLLFWSRGKKPDEVRRMYLFSPVLLGCSMGIPVLFVDPAGSAVLFLWGFLHMLQLDSLAPTLLQNNDSFDVSIGIGMVWLFLAVTCAVVGYGFVGIVLLIERVLKGRGLFRDEEDTGGIQPIPL